MRILYLQSDRYRDAYELFERLKEENPSENEYKRLFNLCKKELNKDVI